MTKVIESVTIVVENRKIASKSVNDVLSEYGEFIVARMGLPVHDRKVSIITVVVESDDEDLIVKMVEKLSKIETVRVKNIKV